jgi:glycosyltransferase involved in cell wall biosynthesis
MTAIIRLANQPAASEFTNSAVDARPGLAVISNCMAPYHVSLHRQIAAGIPEFKLHSLFTHGKGAFDWPSNLPSEINATDMSCAGDSPVVHLLRRPWTELRKAGRLVAYLKRNNVRAVIFNSYNYISYLHLMHFCHRHQIPFFYRNDSNLQDEPKHSRIKQGIKNRIYDWWMKRASGVMSMGAQGDQFFIKYGADPKRLYRVPCSPDYETFESCDPVRLEQFRRKFGLDERRRYLVFSGRLVGIKRVDLLIDAFASVASARSNWDLLLVGDGELREALARRVPEHLQSRVKWTGFLQGPDLPTAMHAADVLVLPSDREAWSLVILEAMAAGLVVISSNVPGAAYELIEDGRSGRIFQAGNLEQLKESILDVTQDGAIEDYKQEARISWEKWTREVDPVAEIRRALADAGVLGANPNTDQ